MDRDIRVTEYRSHDLVVVGKGLIERPDSDWHLITRHHVIKEVAVDALHDAVRDETRCCAELPEYIEIAPDDAPEGALGPTALTSATLLVTNEAVWAETSETSIMFSESVDRKLQRLFDDVVGPDLRVSAFVTDAYGYPIDDPEAEESVESQSTATGTLTVRVAARHPAQSCVGDLLEGAERLSHLIAVIRGRKPERPDVAAHLLRRGLDDPLVGLIESSWFEAKGQPYKLTSAKPASDAAKYDLACDVAALANAEESALLVVGARTKKSIAGDMVVSIVPVPNLTRRDPDRYTKVLDEWIHPPLLGLEVDLVGRDNGSLLLIHVPRQPANLRPFLVTRGWRGDRLSTRQITLPRRVGDRNRYQEAGQLHAALAAGLALLSDPQNRGDG